MNTAWRFVGLILVMSLTLVACGQEPEAPVAPTGPAAVAPPPAVSPPPLPVVAPPSVEIPSVEIPSATIPQPEPETASVAVQPGEEEVPAEAAVVAPVEWDELETLSHMSSRWSGLVEASDPNDRLILVQHLVDAITEVVESDLPPGAYNSAQVEFLQADLRSAARSAMESVEEGEGEDWGEGFESQMTAIQRLVSEMQQALGVPEGQ